MDMRDLSACMHTFLYKPCLDEKAGKRAQAANTYKHKDRTAAHREGSDMEDDSKQLERPREIWAGRSEHAEDTDPGSESEQGIGSESEQGIGSESEQGIGSESAQDAGSETDHEAGGQPTKGEEAQGAGALEAALEENEALREATDRRPADESVPSFGAVEDNPDLPYMERFYATDSDGKAGSSLMGSWGSSEEETPTGHSEESAGSGSEEAAALEAAAKEAAVFALETGSHPDESIPVLPVPSASVTENEQEAALEYADDEAESVMDGESLSLMIEEICISKAQEFRMLGYEYVTGSEIWECVSDKYRKQGMPALHRIVNDILSLKVTSFMNWMTMSAYKDSRIT
ncbi:post-transcriptional regulator [Paenibacillus puerhi]|uniref:post-transcriptional regulator n=1 Tax=Paenibacillus puerhi TaxID=2692622 RepID=UPI002E280DCC|nr:post-transcriptional regulator [Paenibacillus puerhi]